MSLSISGSCSECIKPGGRQSFRFAWFFWKEWGLSGSNRALKGVDAAIMLVLDSHAHCGMTLPLERLLPFWRNAAIDGGVLFSPVEEIYDRYDSNFVDSHYYRESRQRVHSYLKKIASQHIYVFWFVWNDFRLPEKAFTGVKWHRHSNEPKYRYGSEECERFIEHICNSRLPVIIEEEFYQTLELAARFSSHTTVIIPHMGGLNGGYGRLKKAGLFENTRVYVDTALASPYEIEDFAANYGTGRIIFGSDFPFGDPDYERYKIEQIFSGKNLEKILGQNLLELLNKPEAQF
ncbi:predicted metal-dependent hydrolase [Pelotomaculum thermopropionicum SI]|uniref:Predicted metal-dependent hydrolase n=1 Tax=Pelotomaculum thermopropionicum (strain DSM 13744 / JCM 10971 / SI) TaxID=370438 RepID=A5D1N2_PELTS|nr:predicted metal-dependent hydrolase [Pelotomaculum thermopropionicum SI]